MLPLITTIVCLFPLICQSLIIQPYLSLTKIDNTLHSISTVHMSEWAVLLKETALDCPP